MSEDKDLELDDAQVEELEDIKSDEEEEPDYDTLLKQNKELKEKYKKVDGARKHYKTKLEKLNQQPQSKKEEEPEPQSKVEYERLDLKIDGYDDEEVSIIMKMGGKKALDSHLKGYIEKLREDKKLDEATNIKSNGGGTKDKTISEEKLKTMSSAEMEKAILAGKVKLE